MRVGIAGVGGKVAYDPDIDVDEFLERAREGDESADSDEPADSDETGDIGTEVERTLDQLRTGSGGQTVDRKPIFDAGDIDVKAGEWPIGFPLQGVPRVAVTVNLNYVYDEERGEWRRQSPFDGGGGVVIEDSGTVLVDPASGINFGTGLGVTEDGDGAVTVDSTGSGGGVLSGLTYRKVNRSTDTSDISLGANQAVEISNTTGSDIVAVLPPAPADNTAVWVARSDTTNKFVDIKSSPGDEIGGSTSRFFSLFEGDAILCQYFEAGGTWFGAQVA